VAEKRDQLFFDGFMMLVGVFVGLVAGVLMLGDLVGEGAADESADAHAALIERIAPVGQVALAGDPSLTAAPTPAAEAPAPMPAAAAAPVAQRSGEQVYQEACALCHETGVGGAPMISDPAAWAPRLEQDRAVLEDHVINGFQGDVGLMPAKGARADLSDDDVLAAMQHMIDTASQ
jgi:cytochrome c5